MFAHLKICRARDQIYDEDYYRRFLCNRIISEQ